MKKLKNSFVDSDSVVAAKTKNNKISHQDTILIQQKQRQLLKVLKLTNNVVKKSNHSDAESVTTLVRSNRKTYNSIKCATAAKKAPLENTNFSLTTSHSHLDYISSYVPMPEPLINKPRRYPIDTPTKMKTYHNDEQIGCLYVEFQKLRELKVTHVCNMPGKFIDIVNIGRQFGIIALDQRIHRYIADKCSVVRKAATIKCNK